MAPAHSSTAERARRRRAGAAALLLSALVGAGTAAGTPAAAEDYQLCNRTAYILEAALAIETQGSSATQGWFRTLPGSCTVVLENPGEGERYFLHVRTPAFYGEKGETAQISRMFCIKNTDFLLAGAARCADEGGRLAPFNEVGGSGEQRITELTGTPDFDAPSARIAAIQRLLSIAGYEPDAADGNFGARTRSALDAFAAALKAPQFAAASIEATIGGGTVEAGEMPENRAAADDALFSALYNAAVAATEANGLKVCNDSPHNMMAAVGIGAGTEIVSRGWYEVGAGACVQVVRQPLGGEPLYVYAEAVDANGETLVSEGRPLIWGGDEELCTKASQFEITRQGDCGARALGQAGFRRMAADGSAGRTVRLGPENRH